MKRILKISMDVHSTNYTLCAMEPTIGAEVYLSFLTPFSDCLQFYNGFNISYTHERYRIMTVD